MDRDAQSTDGQVIEGRYRIERKIGAGGMGDVYVARQLNVDRSIALKLLKPDRARDERAVAQFLTEATAVSRLTSPHTVTLHDVGQLADGAPYIAMELLEGQTLRDRLGQGGLELEEISRIVDSISLSLAEAHARGVIHRDLKPNNVYLAHTPGHSACVKVLDFGLARLLDAEEDDVRAAGTPPYMAPETLRGGTVDARTDVYALAMVSYELLAGRHPFEDHDGDALLEAQLTEIPPTLDEVSSHELPAAAVALIARSLAKPPRLRPADAGAFRAAWRQAFGLAKDDGAAAKPQLPLSQQPTSPSQTVLSRTLAGARSRSSSSRGLATGALVVAALIAVPLGLAWHSQPDWEDPAAGAVSSSPAEVTEGHEGTADSLPDVAPPPAPEPISSDAPSALPTAEPSRPPRPVIRRAPPSRSASSAAKPAPSSSVPLVEQRVRDYLDD